MLISNLYTVKQSELIDNSINSIITINPKHKIFDGHFPESPVLPGVVQLQIIKELIEKKLKKTFLLQKASNIKYTSIIVPKENEELQITINIKYIDEIVKVNTIIKNNENVFLKFKGSYKEK